MKYLSVVLLVSLFSLSGFAQQKKIEVEKDLPAAKKINYKLTADEVIDHEDGTMVLYNNIRLDGSDNSIVRFAYDNNLADRLCRLLNSKKSITANKFLASARSEIAAVVGADLVVDLNPYGTYVEQIKDITCGQ